MQKNIIAEKHNSFFSLWHQTSKEHALPTINPFEQADAISFTAYNYNPLSFIYQ